MTTAVQRFGTNSALARPHSSSLVEVIDTILDKGLVIDAFVRVSLVGIELITIDARIVVASVDTYLRFAEAVNRLEISSTKSEGLPELMEDMSSGPLDKAKGAVGEVTDAIKGAVPGLKSEDQEKQEKTHRARSK